MADHHIITTHLRDLKNEVLMDLGGALGLRYSHLHNMSRPLLNEMVVAWLNREDHVLSIGDPSWARLIQALKDIHQPGIAKDISEGRYPLVMVWADSDYVTVSAAHVTP